MMGVKIYEIKGINVLICEYNFNNNKYLKDRNEYYLLYRYKTSFIEKVWTEEFFLNVKKEILMKEIQETMYNLKGFYYIN